jgi:hypothetical protein
MSDNDSAVPTGAVTSRNTGLGGSAGRAGGAGAAGATGAAFEATGADVDGRLGAGEDGRAD